MSALTRTRLACIPAVAALLSACGSSSGPTTFGLELYKRQTEPICATAAKDIPAHIPNRGWHPGARLVGRIIRARDRALERLGALTPPATAATRVRRMLRHFRASQALMRLADRIAGQSDMLLPTLLAAAREDGYARQLARELGLTECARL